MTLPQITNADVVAKSTVPVVNLGVDGEATAVGKGNQTAKSAKSVNSTAPNFDIDLDPKQMAQLLKVFVLVESVWGLGGAFWGGLLSLDDAGVCSSPLSLPPLRRSGRERSVTTRLKPPHQMMATPPQCRVPST